LLHVPLVSEILFIEATVPIMEVVQRSEDGESNDLEEEEERNGRLQARVVELINSRLGSSLADKSAVNGLQQELAEKLARVESRYVRENAPTSCLFSFIVCQLFCENFDIDGGKCF
jgi:hypothetical protein